MESEKVQKKPSGAALKTMWLVKAYCELARTFRDELSVLMEKGKFPQTLKAAQDISRKIKKRAGDSEDTYIFHTFEPSLKLASMYDFSHCTDIESAVVELPFMGIDCEPVHPGEWDTECVRVCRNDGTEFKFPVLDVLSLNGKSRG